MEPRKPGTITALRWVLGLVCAAVLGCTLLALVEPYTQPPPDPTQLDEWQGYGEALASLGLLILWGWILAPAAGLLLAIRLRSRAVSLAALPFAGIAFLLGVAATAADGLEGWGDARPWLLAGFAGVLSMAGSPGSLTYLGIRPARNEAPDAEARTAGTSGRPGLRPDR